MTLPNENKRNQYTAAGETEFDYTFKILASAHIDVFVNGVLQGSGFSVSGVGDVNGGTVTFTTAPASGAIITLVRNVPFTQDTDYITGSKFPADSHEEALDLAAMRSLEIQEVLDRTLKLPVTSETASPMLPDPDVATNHGKHLRLKTDGSGFEFIDVSESAVSTPITTQGDIVQGGSGGTPERLAIGSAGVAPTVGDGGKLVYDQQDARTNSTKVAHVVKATTTGTPAVGIGVSTKYVAESADENPSDFGELQFVATDVGAGSEDTVLRVFLRNAGAVLSRAWQFSVGSGFAGILTHSNTASRSYTFPDRNGTVQVHSAVMEGYIDGLITANGSDAAHDIDFGVGVGEVGGVLVKNTSPITKQIDAAWAVGDDAGGLFSGTVANDTWYHMFLMRKQSDGSVDFGFDTSPTGANAPAGWDVRRIGAVLSDGSANIIAYTQYENNFMWDIAVLDDNTTNPGGSARTITLTVPTGLVVRAYTAYSLYDPTPTGTSYGLVTPLAITDTNPATTQFHVAVGVSFEQGTTTVYVETNTSAQIRTRSGASAADVVTLVSTHGWIDPRGRMWV